MAMISFSEIPSLDSGNFPHPHIVTVGVFDGLHRGHQRLIRRTVEKAHAALGEAGPGSAIVFSFSNHPLAALAPPYAPKRLTSASRKSQLIQHLGADVLVQPEFNRAIAEMPPEQFLDEILLGQLRADAIIAGFDFRFGKNGAGNVNLLVERAKSAGFCMEVLPALYQGEWVISSTRIRELIEEGRVRVASEMLGRPYDLEGPVVHGFGRGRQLGYPTANVQFDLEYAVPASGVYAVLMQAGEKSFAGMMNIGISPTFGDAEYRAEVFLFDYNGESLYDRMVRVFFIERIREERKFGSAEELQGRLRVDEKLARAIIDSMQDREFLVSYESSSAKPHEQGMQ